MNHPDVLLVAHRLDQAGRTLMCMYTSGRPRGFTTAWPDYPYERMDYANWHGMPEQKFPRATKKQVDMMHEVLDSWMPKITSIDQRRIVQMRMLINPITDKHLYSWRRIGRKLHMDHKRVKRECEQAIVEMAFKLHAAGMMAALG